MRADRTVTTLIAKASKDKDALTAELTNVYDKLPSKNSPKDWKSEIGRFLTWLEHGGKTPYRIFTKGNSKLPFYSFSTLPMVTCPGAGDCLSWCYSFKSWRYPAAFLRQVQNTYLVINDRDQITEALDEIGHEDFTLRLYVDGDFDSLETLGYWMDVLGDRPHVKAYGYSKSWEQFLAYSGDFPENYSLNLSSGSRHDDDLKKQMKGLSCVRGEFVADESLTKQDAGKTVKTGDETVFVCPGKCGSCLPSGKHACGLLGFKRKIAIWLH